MAGTNDRGGEQGGVPATGRRFRCPGASIGRLRYGKIIEQRDYWNMTARRRWADFGTARVG